MQQLLLGYSILAELDYSRVPSSTFIHCSVRRIDSKLQATVAGLMSHLLEAQARHD
jgi:hypothetical protein